KLVLALGEHDTDYVDAYYGPPEWRDAVKAQKRTVDQIHTDAVALDKELRARAEMLQGKKLTFDEESKALYDAVAPHHDESYFEQLTAQLNAELPGDGAIADRLDAFKKDFIIPKEKLDAVFKRAIEGCRARTLQHMELPAGETFTIEYVTNKSWSGYNWYKGNFHSLIQVNTDLPIYIDRAIDIAFPANERVEFEKTNLFPLAGLDASKAAKYYRVQELVGKLAYAGNEAARGYLDGKLTADQAVNWLTRYALMSEPRARQRLKFIEQYRSYVINYNLGKDLVAKWVQGNWDRFKLLLSSPRLPSSLK